MPQKPENLTANMLGEYAVEGDETQTLVRFDTRTEAIIHQYYGKPKVQEQRAEYHRLKNFARQKGLKPGFHRIGYTTERRRYAPTGATRRRKKPFAGMSFPLHGDSNWEFLLHPYIRP